MTQMEHAKKGFITEEMKTVALKENRSAEYIAAGIADGTIVIPGNVNRHFSCVGIGKGLKTKVNANIGTSGESCSLEKEIKKLETAVRYGAHSIMDLSTGRNIAFTRKTIAGKCPVMLGTVPVYEVFAENLSSGKRLKDITADDFFSTLHMHAEDGADFVTVHCGITSRLLHAADPKFRTAGMVSRGGSLTAKWMAETGNENPYFEYFDRVLDIAHEYDITVSLGDGMRPGAIADAGDSLQLGELEILGSLVKRCRERNVQVIVEGPGHVPIDEIRYHVEMQKEICADAPFYVLGPLVCDIAPGYDHITGAIGGALAASYGADFLCYVTPAEHLCLPDEEDVKQGVIASVIAAHAGDVAKKVPGAEKLNREMSLCRKNLDWEGMFGFAIDPETARSRRASSESAEKDYCSMCGELCAMKESL